VRHAALLTLLFALAACAPAEPPVAPPPPPPPAPAAPPRPVTFADDPAAAAQIAADVTYLASPELAGRGTGDEGAKLAAQHVADRFAKLGLAPAGDGQAANKFWQAFQARIGASAKLVSAEIARGKAKKPIAAQVADGSASGRAEGEAVFVGYGITASAVGWDDYAGQDLSGKIAVVLDGVPPQKEGATTLRDFGSVRYKLRTAREHKAAGVLLVTRKDLPAPPTDASSMGVPGIVATVAEAKSAFPSAKLDDERATWAVAKAGKPKSLGAHAALEAKIDPVEATAWNVIGLLPARADSPKKDEVVIVGAHYDHLGMGGPHSRAVGVKAVHPGADDNASGTALMLDVARRFAALAPEARPDRALLFMAFGAEEIGAIGSRFWVEHPTIARERVVAMINADMVGRLRDNKLVVDGVGTSAGWKPLVDAAAQGLNLDLAFGAEGFGASDHASFTAARIPVAFFFTGVHPEYHMPTDTADKINSEGEERIATLAARLALGVAQAPDKLVFVDAPPDPHRGMRGGFKVSLGSIPDYAFSGKGVKLDGVRPDAPAARAGLQRGDVIVKLGSHDVANIHDYMFALGELEPGKKTTVVVERAGQRLTLEIVPAPGK
jgi:Zn-dependent M28 family amino/carboxypeptidase